MAGGIAWQGSSTKRKGQSGELIGLRTYAKGDPLRSIHWKVSAKQGRLVVRENAAEAQSQYSLYIDPSSYLWSKEETFEKMCSLAASLAEDLFLESKLDTCCIAGKQVIQVNRVLDLETFFDKLASLVREESRASKPEESSRDNFILFGPLEGHSVGAFANGIKIAQA